VSKNSSEETQRALNNEIKILQTLDHPNIIKYYESFVYKNHLCIVTEYAESGDLQRKIKDAKSTGGFAKHQILDWFCQLALAIGHIHSKNILHRDLKPKNILLTKFNQIKIGDFGISKMLENTFDMAKTATGTPYYLSPEVCLGQRYDHKSDMWMLGCILYELCTLRRPFEGESLNLVLNKITKAAYKPLPESFEPIFH
jgi:NIMA (never in mitosis gene a)-related kinase 1/4/5